MGRPSLMASYLANPNHCQHCGKPLLPPNDHSRATKYYSYVSKLKYCSSECRQADHTKHRVCRKCGGDVIPTHRGGHGGYYASWYCDQCKSEGYHHAESGEIKDIGSRTLAILRERYPDRRTARAVVTRHAARVFKNHGGSLDRCLDCGYDKHAEICHIRAVADFPETATLAEVNAFENLTVKCDNCHVAFDHPEWLSADHAKTAVRYASRYLQRLHLTATIGQKKTERGDTWRGYIKQAAAAIYWGAGAPYQCRVDGCDFHAHIELCHLRRVCDFPDTATIAEVNAIENLAGLCPNHHWELDHGLLDVAYLRPLDIQPLPL